jgi:D-3-phosphoglycerate dehydrogenase
MVTDYAWPTLDIEKSIVTPAGGELVVAGKDDHSAMLALAPQSHAILVNWNRLTADVIAAATKCLIITRYGVGVDNIHIATATEQGIVVCNVPDYCMDEVSNEAMALLLCGARRTLIYDRAVRSGTWDVKTGMPFARLRGQTLGIVGFGRIGRALAPKALSFGLRVIACDPYINQSEMLEHNVIPADLDSLLRESDYISLHTPLTPETRHLINDAALRKMKPTAWLVNTARGPIVDTTALVVALREGRLAGAGLDVLPQEPPDKHDPLYDLPNVVLTPHSAFYSEGSLQELLTKSATRIAEALRGETPSFIVNPEVLQQPNCRLLHRRRE